MRRVIAEQLNPHFGYFYTAGATRHRSSTKFQELEIVDTDELGKVMLLDDVTQVAVRNEWMYHEPMVHPALTAVDHPNRVLVIGAGDGGIVREVLRHNPQRVVHAELDGGVVECCREHLPEISQGCWDDPRVDLQIGDGRQWVETSSETFDAAIMDMTDPFGPSTMLYTHEFFSSVKARLTTDGCFTMHAESPISRPQAYQQILRTLGSVWQHVTVFHVYIQMYAVQWAVAVAADHNRLAELAADAIDQRLAERGITGLHLYDGRSHHGMQAGFPWIRELEAKAAAVPVVTDAEPTFIDEIDINQGMRAFTIMPSDA